MKNILVLGGNGYLGSKVIKALSEIRDGNTSKYKIFCAKRENSDLSKLKNMKDIKWISCENNQIHDTLKSELITTVLNLACNYGKNNDSYSNTLDSNLFFPLKVLDASLQYGLKNFITIGTGLPDNLNMYSFSKKILGDFGNFYAEKHSINFVNVKLEMFYGADEPRDRFIPFIISKMLCGEDVNTTLGTQRRDIIAVEDAVYAIKSIVQSEIKGYNEISVGTGIAPTIAELVEYIWDKTGKKSVVTKGSIKMRCHEPDCVADTTLLNTLCEWAPVSWQEGILRMIEKICQMEAER